MDTTVLLERLDVIVEGSASPVSFQTEGGGDWKVWDRYIVIDGKKAFHIGNVCGTCSFFFERLEGANRSISAEDVADELNAGVTHLNPGLVRALQKIMPNGAYRVLLQRLAPSLVRPGEKDDYFTSEQIQLWGVNRFWGLPHYPKTEYYRVAARRLPSRRGLFEFVIPTFPSNWLNHERVVEYCSQLAANHAPTAVTLSVLDVKQPGDWEGEPEVTSHWCLAHYLLDGHHKVFAASAAKRELTLLSFLAVEHGVSSAEEVEELLQVIREV